MTGLALAVFTFAGQATTTTERAELAAAVATIQQLAEQHLRVRPTDTPQILAFRHRLAGLVDYTTRWVAACDRRPLGLTDYSNLVQVLRDVCDHSRGLLYLTSRQSEVVFWHLAGLNATDKALALYKVTRSLRPPEHINPAQRPDLERQVELVRMMAAQEVARWVASSLAGLR